MINTIVFDFGGVILTNDWHHDPPLLEQDFEKRFFINNRKMELAWNLHWKKFRIGAITENQFWENFFETSGAKNSNIEDAKKIWRKHQHLTENMMDLIKNLKNRFKIFGLTNISKEWLDYKIKKYNLDQYFDVIVSSGYTGYAKPDVKIYEILLQKTGSRPEDVIFIDNTKHLLEPAAKLGMKTILFKNQKLLEKKLCELGLL